MLYTHFFFTKFFFIITQVHLNEICNFRRNNLSLLRRVPPVNVRILYALGITTLFPKLRDPNSKNGYVSINSNASSLLTVFVLVYPNFFPVKGFSWSFFSGDMSLCFSLSTGTFL